MPETCFGHSEAGYEGMVGGFMLAERMGNSKLGSPLLWNAVKQHMISQSIAEAELQAMAAGLQLTMAVREHIEELGVDV